MKADRKEVGTHIIEWAVATVDVHNGRIEQGMNRDGEKHFCAELVKHLSGSHKQTFQSSGELCGILLGQPVTDRTFVTAQTKAPLFLILSCFH